jgi:hypothetical protein
VVLAQTDSQADAVATWLSVAGQWVGALGTIAAVGLALWLAQRETRRITAERRDREAAQARLVVIELEYPEFGDPGPYPHLGWTKITNHSEHQPVFRPRIESMGGPRPKVRWALDVAGLDGSEWWPTEVLHPKGTHHVPFEHVVNGRSVRNLYGHPSPIKKWVEIDDVTVTFTDAAGLRWRRTGTVNRPGCPASSGDRGPAVSDGS